MISSDSTLSELFGRLISAFTSPQTSSKDASNQSVASNSHDVCIFRDLANAVSFCLHIFCAMLIRYFLDHSYLQGYITRTVMTAVQLVVIVLNLVPAALQVALLVGLVYAFAPQINQLLTPAMIRIQAYVSKYVIPHQPPVTAKPVEKPDPEITEKLKISVQQAIENAMCELQGKRAKYQTSSQPTAHKPSSAELTAMISKAINEAIHAWLGETSVTPHIDKKKEELARRIVSNITNLLNTSVHPQADHTAPTPVHSGQFKPKPNKPNDTISSQQRPKSPAAEVDTGLNDGASKKIPRPASPDDDTDSELTTPPASPVPTDKNDKSSQGYPANN